MSEPTSRAAARVFLVVVDESPELANALRYACRRAKRTGGRVAMLYVMDPPEGNQWGSVVAQPDVVDGDDVGVLEGPGDPCLAEKARRGRGRRRRGCTSSPRSQQPRFRPWTWWPAFENR